MAESTKKPNIFQRWARSFKDMRGEMKKVVWPTKKELGSYTAVVVLTCAFFALAFWAIDSGFLALLKAVLNIEL